MVWFYSEYQMTGGIDIGVANTQKYFSSTIYFASTKDDLT